MSSENQITRTVETLIASLPSYVTLVAAAKKRTPSEVAAAIRGGLHHIGHNYIQESTRMLAEISPELRSQTSWHLIGHLQRNKAQQAIHSFDIIETVDSVALGKELNRHCAEMNKTQSILIEINSWREVNKTGVFPEDALDLVMTLSQLTHLSIEGLMTMGPFGDEGLIRSCFKETRSLYETLTNASIPQIKMRHLSMGMSDSYRIAIDEGANMIRLGTKIFGPRP